MSEKLSQKIFDEISYDFYLRDSDKYFQDKLVPSVIYDIFSLQKESISPDPIVRTNKLKERFAKIIKDKGYPNVSIDNVFEYYPVFVSDKLDLLGEYIANSPLCQFLEKGSNPYELLIKLNGKSSNPDLNTFGSLLKEPFGFYDLVLVYDYNPDIEINFLKLRCIYDEKNNISLFPNNSNWLKYLQSGYFELFMGLTMYHALWHLGTAYITCVAKESIKNDDLVKVFTMSEQNIFTKANEVKAFFLQSPLLFNVILYDNPVFMEWVEKWMNGFVDNFNIDTFYETNVLRGLNPKQKWIPGFKENLLLVKNLSQSIMLSTNPRYWKTQIWSWNCYKNVNCYDKTINVSKLIQILYTFGSVYHSHTLEYQKMAFTELIYNEKIPKNFNQVLLSTLSWDIDFPIFGNYEYYCGITYLRVFKEFDVELNNTRKQITKLIENNKIYKSFIYAITEEATEHYNINTWNTRI